MVPGAPSYPPQEDGPIRPVGVDKFFELVSSDESEASSSDESVSEIHRNSRKLPTK